MHEGVGGAERPRFRADFLGQGRDLRRLLARRRRGLSEVLAGEVLPRVLARGGGPARGADPGGLARLLVAGRFEEARAALAARLASGAAFSSLMLRDVAPAARRLGVWWAEDSCDFVDVTRAAGGLSDLLRDLARDAEALADAPAIAVAPAPGETHRLGADIVARMFRLAGWRAVCCAAHELCETLAGDWFDLAGFSLGCDRFAGALPDAIAAARAASRNRRLAVVVGGAAIAAEPAIGAGLDAEVCFADPDIAVHFPHSLLRAFPL